MSGATVGAKRLGFLAGVLVVDGIEFGFVQHGVADGGEVHRQPQQARDGVFRAKGGESADPVQLADLGDGRGGSCTRREQGWKGERRAVPGLIEDGVHGHSVRLWDGVI